METQPLGETAFYLMGCSLIALVLVIVLFSLKTRKLKLLHQHKILMLKELVVHLLETQEAQSGNIRLADELLEKVKSSNVMLSSEIVEMLHEFIETLTQNNLLKK